MHSVPNHREKELLSRIAAGNEEAFRELHDFYWNDVYSLALAFTKSPPAAEDLVQEIFLKLWMKRDKFEHVENFRAFFMILVRNQVISALRKNKKQEKDLQSFLKTTSNTQAQLSTQEVNEASRLVSQTISSLPPKQQQIFKMSREEGLNHDDIASQLNLSKKTVSNTITIILGVIRKQLYKNDLLLMVLYYFTIR